MRITICTLVLFAFGFVSCSNDGEMNETETGNGTVAINAIGADGAAIYQYSKDGNQEVGVTTSLSSDLGLGSDYLTLRQVGSILSFYTFNQGKFSLFQKDIATGGVQTYIDFYTNTPARSVVWGINNEDTVFFGYYNPEGTTNLAIQNVGLDDFQGSDLSLEFNIDRLYQPIYHDGKLYVTYRNGALEYKISVYDTATFSLVQTLEYGTDAPSILIDDNGNLAVFKFSDTATVFLEIRDVDTLAVLETFDFELNQSFLPGPMNAELKEGKLYYGYEYSQPFDLQIGPAVLDIRTGENNILDLLGALNSVENTEDISTYVVWQQYDSVQDVFLISYGIYSDSPLLSGGILVQSADGRLLENIALPFVPTYFVK